jgi:hypothetical protein
MKKRNLVLLTLASLPAFADPSGNGGGYNGPNLAGTSVPVSVDRAVTTKQVRAAYLACALELSDKLGQQILKGQKFRNSISSNGADGLYGDSDISEYTYWNTSDNMRTHGFLVLHGRDTAAQGAFQFILEGNYTVRAALEIKEGLPRFLYTTEIPDGGYDELGNPIQDSMSAKDLKMSYPTNYGPAVPLVNTDTLRVTSVTVNMVKFANCLIAQVQQ